MIKRHCYLERNVANKKATSMTPQTPACTIHTQKERDKSAIHLTAGGPVSDERITDENPAVGLSTFLLLSYLSGYLHISHCLIKNVQPEIVLSSSSSSYIM